MLQCIKTAPLKMMSYIPTPWLFLSSKGPLPASFCHSLHYILLQKRSQKEGCGGEANLTEVLSVSAPSQGWMLLHFASFCCPVLWRSQRDFLPLKWRAVRPVLQLSLDLPSWQMIGLFFQSAPAIGSATSCGEVFLTNLHNSYKGQSGNRKL